jgi:Stealth protein CR2, conserved region 2/Stealth protein CR3, conserved region 3/Stealth protein CR1, conserved region 1
MKIDIVYTWVNGNDTHWNSKRIENTKLHQNLLPEANSNARFMDNDELKFSLRSIYQYAPWINNIFIVTDNQIPDWLNLSHPKIKIVDHKDIFYDKSCLPTFSARGIESQIHHIKELSEHFIYFNDDMFLGNYCTPDHFFTKNGLPHIFVSEIIPIPSKKSFDISKRTARKRNDHQHAIVNTRKLIKAKFNKSVYYNIRHGAKPLVKSILFDLENIFKTELEKTYHNSFRTENDILMFHLFEYYALIKKIGKAKYLKTVSKKKSFADLFSSSYNNYTFGYINLHDDNIENNLNSIKERRPLIICLNQTPATPQENIEKINKILPEFYPDKSPFEKD